MQALGAVLCAAIFLHNVAEVNRLLPPIRPLSLLSGNTHSRYLSLSLFSPQGFVVAVPILAGTGSRSFALLATVLSGLSEPVGALLGVLMLRTWMAQFVSLSLSLSLSLALSFALSSHSLSLSL